MEFDLREFLTTEIGYEEPRVRRQNMFNKLCRLATAHGLPVVRIIAEAWAEACERFAGPVAKHWFLKTVKLRLIDEGLWKEDRGFGAMTMAEIINSGVFRRRARLPLFEGQGEPPPAADETFREKLERMKKGMPPNP